MLDGIQNIIAIASGKGGVGKTVSSINIGAGLKKLGKSVLILDGNFLSPNLHFDLGTYFNGGIGIEGLFR